MYEHANFCGSYVGYLSFPPRLPLWGGVCKFSQAKPSVNGEVIRENILTHDKNGCLSSSLHFVFKRTRRRGKVYERPGPPVVQARATLMGKAKYGLLTQSIPIVAQAFKRSSVQLTTHCQAFATASVSRVYDRIYRQVLAILRVMRKTARMVLGLVMRDIQFL